MSEKSIKSELQQTAITGKQLQNRTDGTWVPHLPAVVEVPVWVVLQLPHLLHLIEHLMYIEFGHEELQAPMRIGLPIVQRKVWEMGLADAWCKLINRPHNLTVIPQVTIQQWSQSCAFHVGTGRRTQADREHSQNFSQNYAKVLSGLARMLFLCFTFQQRFCQGQHDNHIT